MTDSGVWFGWDPLWVSTAILVLSYGAIMTERVNRAVVALVGAGVMVLSGVIDQETAIAGEDFNTLALLIGMMLLVAISRRSGMFQYVAIWSAKLGRGKPWVILALLSLVTGMFYPLAVTAIAQVVFPEQANGSLIEENDKLLGSGTTVPAAPTRNVCTGSIIP